MADGILSGIADVATESAKAAGSAAVDTIKDIGKGATHQLVGPDNPEVKAQKEAEKMATHQRIQALESEMRQIAAQNVQKTGPKIEEAKQKSQTSPDSTTHKPAFKDLASQLAATKGETGRGTKG